MGRRRKYHTAEEARLAANAKSRRSYHKNKSTVSSRRQEDYQKRKEQRLQVTRQPTFGPCKSIAVATQEPGIDAGTGSQPDEQDNPRNVAYWTKRVERVAKRLTKEVGPSPFTFMENLYSNYQSTHDNQDILNAVLRIEKLKKCTAIYLHEILQLSGCGDEYRRGQEVARKVSSLFSSLDDLGLHTTICDDGMPDFETLHDRKEFLYQTLLVSE
ncbi:hypothetical protein H0H93_013893 [Arthromyces matolae]|nr:hypothetical protein H0H93_013893 [Arthromyces matolae]